MKYKSCNLPLPLLKLATEGRRPTEGRYGITELNGSPRIAQLKRRHWDDIEIDPTENLWMVFGKLLHSQLEGREEINALAEERIKVRLLDRDVVGIVDHYADGVITDYKFVSTWAAKDGVKPDWEAQLNCYAYLLESVGFPVTKLQICCIYRDWSQMRSETDKEYPPRAEVLKVSKWHPERIEGHLRDRLQQHIAAESLDDKSLPHCTDDERWCSPGKWALMKEGNKRAVKLCDTEEEANKAMAAVQAGRHFLTQRPTEYRRCERCEVRGWCNQVAAGQSTDEKLEAVGL